MKEINKKKSNHNGYLYSKYRPTVIAYSLIVLLILIIIALFWVIVEKITIPESIAMQFGAIIGFLTAKISSIIDFDFGDSYNSGNKIKDNISVDKE